MDEAVDEVMDEMYSKVADRGLLKADIAAMVTQAISSNINFFGSLALVDHLMSPKRNEVTTISLSLCSAIEQSGSRSNMHHYYTYYHIFNQKDEGRWETY